MPLLVLHTSIQAYRLLWRDRLLLLGAIWPPVLFLVVAEFLYHRVVGNAEGLAGRVHAVLAAPWYMPLGAVVAWLAGLKFLLSFSISWRRHLVLGEKFDPFFFKAPFWRYLGFLLLTYAWIVPLMLLSSLPAAMLAASHAPEAEVLAAFLLPVAAALVAIWGVVRQVPFFTSLALGRRLGWRACAREMRGTVLRYVAVFVLVMLPVVLLNVLLDAGLERARVDRHAVQVALGESAFRQSMLFTHFALGAALGVITTTTLFGALPSRPPARG